MPVNKIKSFMTSKIGLLTVYLIASVLFAYSVYDAFFSAQEIYKLKSDINQAIQSGIIANPEITTVNNTKQITSYHLFGKTTDTRKPVLNVDKAPATRLKLVLHGLVVSDEEEASKAIISIDDKQVMLFSTGDKLPKSNAEIYDIQPGRILLKRNGKLESLEIDRPSLGLDGWKKASKENIRLEDKLLILDIPEESGEGSIPPPDHTGE